MHFYVYELLDPRDKTVFYVGKGKGGRLYHHEREAKSGKYSPKCCDKACLEYAKYKVEFPERLGPQSPIENSGTINAL